MKNHNRHVKGSLVWSDFEGAEDRRYTSVMEAPQVDRPYLLVNDHPTKYAPGVASTVAQLVARYADAGWRVLIDDRLEAEVRASLPAGRLGRTR